MAPADSRPPSPRRLGVAALLAGLVVFVLQFPWGGGVDTDPPTCYGMFWGVDGALRALADRRGRADCRAARLDRPPREVESEAHLTAG